MKGNSTEEDLVECPECGEYLKLLQTWTGWHAYCESDECQDDEFKPSKKEEVLAKYSNTEVNLD